MAKLVGRQAEKEAPGSGTHVYFQVLCCLACRAAAGMEVHGTTQVNAARRAVLQEPKNQCQCSQALKVLPMDVP